jgi:23S rRNA pseudouridine2605 synthase
MAEGERLQKVLARGGVASRRDAEAMITQGRVTVNGEVVTALGTRVDPVLDRVEVDGRAVEPEARVYFLFHKPKGIVTTLDDPEGRPAIKDFVKDLGARVFPIGRLDFHTSGALLLTNDGALANALLHPRKSVAKTYVAKVRGVPTDEQVQMMRDGVVLNPVADEPPDPARTRPAEVEVLRSVPSGEGSVREAGTTWMEITLREGRNRQIHRMAEAVGLFVMRLARISFAGMTTEGLRAGQMRPLTAGEVSMLRRTYLGVQDEPAPTPRVKLALRGERGPAPTRSSAPRAAAPDRRSDAPVSRGRAPGAPSTRESARLDAPRGSVSDRSARGGAKGSTAPTRPAHDPRGSGPKSAGRSPHGPSRGERASSVSAADRRAPRRGSK